MIVLGLTDAAPCGAAIVIDGVVVAALDEMALSHISKTLGPMSQGIPRRALIEVLKLARVTARDIDLVMVAGIDRRPVNRLRRAGATSVRRPIGALFGALLGVALLPVFAVRRRMIRGILDQEFAITAPVEFVHHHLAHAACAYFTSGFDDAIALTMDNGGDGDRAHVYDIRNGHFRRIGGARIVDAEPAVGPGDAQSVADFVARHLGGNKPNDLVVAGAAFADSGISRRLGELTGIERVYVQPGGAASGLAPGAALAACMLNRKQGRMVMSAVAPSREPEMARP